MVTTMTPMLQQVTLGAVSLGNIAIHALVMIVILRCREGIKAILPSSRPALSLVGVMVAAVSIPFAAISRDFSNGLSVSAGGQCLWGAFRASVSGGKNPAPAGKLERA